MSRAGLFGNSYSLIILQADMHSLVPLPCLSEQPQPLVLSVWARLLPAGARTALMVLFSVRQGNRHQLLILFFVHCKQRCQRVQNVLPLWTKHLPPISVLASPPGSLQCHPICSFPFSWEPGNSTDASWVLLFLKNFLLPPVLLLVFCNSQFLFFFSQSAGFLTKQTGSFHIDFVKEWGNMPRDLLHTNTQLWWGGMWSSSRTVWGNRLFHSFVSPSPLFVMPFYYTCQKIMSLAN